MLVAPLMTPLPARGLASPGIMKLLAASLRAVGLGYTQPLDKHGRRAVKPNPRHDSGNVLWGAPNLLDLAVGLVSGFAAAYAYSSTISAALPGVAIAAALVLRSRLRVFASPSVKFMSAPARSCCLPAMSLPIIVGATCAFYSFGLRGEHPADLGI